MSDKKQTVKLIAIASNFAWEVIVAILIGFFIGIGLDHWLGFERLFVIIFMIIGAIAAVRNFMVRVYKLGEKYDEEE